MPFHFGETFDVAEKFDYTDLKMLTKSNEIYFFNHLANSPRTEKYYMILVASENLNLLYSLSDQLIYYSLI